MCWNPTYSTEKWGEGGAQLAVEGGRAERVRVGGGGGGGGRG